MPTATANKLSVTRETKTLHFQIKATGITTNEDGQSFGHIEAYGAAFGNVDEGNDRINKGAFTRTIQNSKARAKARSKKYILKMLWQHDPNEIIGGWYDLSEDNQGLLAKGDIALSTRRGQEFYDLALAEMIDEFSIIYDVVTGGAHYDKSGVRELTEMRLFSIDPVTFPMNDDPHTVAIKSKELDPMLRNKADPDAKQSKTVSDHFNDGMAKDLLEDWQDVYICALTSAVFDALASGDTLAPDVSQALDDFKTIVMEKFVAQAVECNLSQYVAESGYTYSPAATAMQNGSDDGYSPYGYMSRRLPETKAGRSLSAAKQSAVDTHVSDMHDLADQAMKSMKAGIVQMKAVHTAADDFATSMQGAEKPFAGNDPGTPDDDQQEGKSLPWTSQKELENALQTLQSL